MEGGKGTRPSFPPLPRARDFSALQLLLAATGVLGALLELEDDVPPDDVLPEEDEELSLEDVLLDEDELLLLLDEDEPPSFFVEP